ncbi:MAG: M48 family metallopeptidase [Bacteroidota bacterium]|nr:M48 family metallopeptidase [Bacteroidota bacterium]
MDHVYGQYFDGISSKPQEIELWLDKTHAELRFDLPANQTNHWAIGETSFENIGDTLEIRCSNHPLALIKVTDNDFAAEFIAYLKTKGRISFYQRAVKLESKAHVVLAVLILGIVAAVYLAVIPWGAEKAVKLIPHRYDISMGRKLYKQYLNGNSIDTAKTKALNSFARQLRLRNTQKLYFTVINSPTVNALALPDGNVIVFTGLINILNNYDELAGLIGHEVSHINNRHSMKMLCRNLSGRLFISAALSDVNGITTVIGNNVQELQSLSYSRQFERQADEEGTDLMIDNGINPKGMTELFTRLQSSENVAVPVFISSHPITTDRIVYIKRRVNDLPHRYLFDPELERLFRQVKK